VAGVPAVAETSRVQLWPWQYLFESFNKPNFPDLYNVILVASVALLIATVVFYNVRMYEWMLWTCVILFSLLIVYWIFRFDWIIVFATIVGGLGVLVWTRFVRFPPYFKAYERQLAKQRYYSRQRYAHPETTIRSKSSRRRRRR
jgi:hypothetical protein